jgi:hypothetical protein
MKRRLAGKPIKFWRYRDFGSLVSLSEYSTLGDLLPPSSQEPRCRIATLGRLLKTA